MLGTQCFLWASLLPISAVTRPHFFIRISSPSLLQTSFQEAEEDAQLGPEPSPGADIRPPISLSLCCPSERLFHFVAEHQAAVCASQTQSEPLEDRRSTDGAMLGEE